MNKKSVIRIMALLVIYIILIIVLKSTVARILITIIYAAMNSFFARNLFDEE